MRIALAQLDTTAGDIAGNRTAIANNTTGRGPLPAYSFVAAGPNGLLWLSGDAGYSIAAIDATTGDRVIAAK